MKLASPFYRLPVSFDIERLQYEAAQFAESDWQRHPTGFAGNSALRLISVDGGENDDFGGRMAPTPQLKRCPYFRQVLASFGVVWSRARLMRLSPGSGVPLHSDVNYHWFHRTRIHIPVVTDPAVDFSCDGQTVQMAAGEAWIFDNWRPHAVHNGSARERIHLVADTTGNAAFWDMVDAGQSEAFHRRSGSAPLPVPYQPGTESRLYFERYNVPLVLSPSEIEQLTIDLLVDLRPPQTPEQQPEFQRFFTLAMGLCREWRTLWSLYADTAEGWPLFEQLRDYVARELANIVQGPVCASNGLRAVEVMYSRVLLYALGQQSAALAPDVDRTLSAAAAPASAPAAARSTRLPRPLFIVAAPRSGSTLLFETLAQARGVFTLGGEGHALVEDLPQLRPTASDVGSNRLTRDHVNQAVRQHIEAGLRAQLRDRDGRPLGQGEAQFLEKTPKNALRIPFFDALFPDARFVFLWRDPRENLSSIIEAWRSGGWKMYQELPGWDGPWSMLVPPGYEALRGRPLEEVAAFQWSRTNQMVMDDLSRLSRERWMALSYADFVADPAAVTRRICEFAGLDSDEQHAAYLARPLPLSAHTLTAPAPGKWKHNEELIARVMPQLEPLVAQIAAFGSGGAPG